MICSICGGNVDEAFPAKCLEENCKEVFCDACALGNNFKCKKHTIKKVGTQLEEVRRSDIEKYKECPHAFDLQVIQGKQTSMGVYADIGIHLHDIFDISSKTLDFDTDTMRKQYDEFFRTLTRDKFEGCQRKLPVDDFILQQHEKGYRNIDGYKTLCMHMPIPWKTEERISIPIPNSSIRATIAFDRINKNDNGSYDLLDYKTGKVHVGTKLENDLQPALYIRCVEENYGIKIERFIFLFTGECKERIFQRIGDDTFECVVGKKPYKFSISEKIQEISKIFQCIERGEFDIPSDLHPWNCENMCGSYKTGDCGGKIAGMWTK